MGLPDEFVAPGWLPVDVYAGFDRLDTAPFTDVRLDYVTSVMAGIIKKFTLGEPLINALQRASARHDHERTEHFSRRRFHRELAGVVANLEGRGPP